VVGSEHGDGGAARPSGGRRLLRWLQTPPLLRDERGFGAAALWSITGAVGAGLTLSVIALVSLSQVMGYRLSAPLTLLWLAPAVVVVTIPSFAACYALYYFVLFPRKLLTTRVKAAGYVIGWHLSAHVFVLSRSEQGIFNAFLIAPVAVGAVWGSWLPVAVTAPAD
jgi:hypothetical protein